jgi:archaeal flagellar protein FlaJ
VSVATDPGLSAGSFLRSVLASYRHMEMPARRYGLFVVSPALGFALLVTLATLFLPVPATIGLPLAVAGLFATLVALAYPKVLEDRRRTQIDQRFHLFLTHITVLSLTNIDRIEVFRTLAAEEEYGPLADEMGRIVALVETWNQSLEDACRLRAKRVPSDLLADFLERLAYTVGAGQEVSEFLVSEQEGIVQQFSVRYENDLAKLDVMTELYLSMMLAATFTLVFGLILPFLVGISPTLLLVAVISLFGIVQLSFLVLINGISPYDPVWYLPPDRPLDRRLRIYGSLAVGVVLTLFASALALAAFRGLTPLDPTDVPLPVFVAVAITPLAIPALVVRHEEGLVKRRDEDFPRFIRALGSVESVKQSSTTNVLSTLRHKDFGALTEGINRLYRRLFVRIDATRAWRQFAADSGSWLIQKFADMYVIGREMGGEPKHLGSLISRNIRTLLTLREQRQQATTTLVGIVYGISAASVFAAYIGLEIVVMLIGVADGIEIDDPMISGLFNPELYSIPTIEALLLVVILVNATLSGLMIRLTDRGRLLNALGHVVALVWVGAVVATITAVAVDALIVI